MHFEFNIALTEEDYIAFNNFHSFDSIHGRKQIRKTRIIFIATMLLLMALVVFLVGWTVISTTYVVLLSLFTALYMLLFRKVLNRNLKTQIKKLKKTGKLPFDPNSKFEFHEDKMVETSASKRSEQGYDAIERICVVSNRFILIYNSSIQAYILPILQIDEQLNKNDFLSFLSQKCNTIEYY